MHPEGRFLFLCMTKLTVCLIKQHPTKMRREGKHSSMYSYWMAVSDHPDALAALLRENKPPISLRQNAGWDQSLPGGESLALQKSHPRFPSIHPVSWLLY